MNLCKWPSFFARIWNIDFSIDLVIFLTFMALSSIYVSEHTILYETVCHQTLDHVNADQGCDLTRNQFIRDRVQTLASSWTSILSVTYVLPAIIGNGLLGAWSDQYGRKDCLVVALASAIVTTVPDALLTYYVRAPVYTLVASTAVAGITGSGSTILSLSLAYVTDGIRDRKKLTCRMTILFACKSLGAVTGALLLGSLRPRLSFAKNILVAEVILIVAFLYTLIKMPSDRRSDQNCSTSMKLKAAPDTAAYQQVRKTPPSSLLATLFKTVWTSNLITWRTLIRKRRGHKRLYLVMITAGYFLYVMSEFCLLNGPIFSFYVFDSPFYWGPSELSKFRGAQNLSALLGILLGLLLLQKFPLLSDTMLIIVSLLSGFSYLLLVAFARCRWTIYAGTSLGVLSSLIMPACKSFLTLQVSRAEVGKVLAANGITAELGFLATRLAFTNIYATSLDSGPRGLVFLIGAGGIAVALVTAIGIHVQWSNRKRRMCDLMVHKGVVPRCKVISSSSHEARCFL